MNRVEALRILGLDEDATADDIKIAYKETVQILHPDRFAGNKKLQDRATEQFKNLQEAYEYLTRAQNTRTKTRHTSSPWGESASDEGGATGYSTAREIEARLAGIAAARVQLAKQRDALYDERRNGIVMAAVGGIAALLFRKPGVFAVIAGLGVVAAFTGIVQAVRAQMTLRMLDGHINELSKEQRRLAEELESLG